MEPPEVEGKHKMEFSPAIEVRLPVLDTQPEPSPSPPLVSASTITKKHEPSLDKKLNAGLATSAQAANGEAALNPGASNHHAISSTGDCLDPVQPQNDDIITAVTLQDLNADQESSADNKRTSKTSSKNQPSEELEDAMQFVLTLDKRAPKKHKIPKCAHFASRNVCRFELPIDIKHLEDHTTWSYLKKYCIILPLKNEYYRKHYNRHCRINLENVLKIKNLKSTFEDLFGRPLDDKELEEFNAILPLNPNNTTITEDEFVCLAAVFERFLRSRCIYPNLEKMDPRDPLEALDFVGLKERISTVNIDPELKALLHFVPKS